MKSHSNQGKRVLMGPMDRDGHGHNDLRGQLKWHKFDIQEAADATKTQLEEPNDFYKIAKQRSHTGPGPFNWEVRLAWTELINGVWSPKRVSQSQLVVNWPLAQAEDIKTYKRVWPGLPLIANFIFAAETDRSDIKIRIAYQYAGQTTGKPPRLQPVGSFAISEERVVIFKAEAQSDKLGLTIPTSFHKFSWDTQPDNVASGAPFKAPGDSVHSYERNVDAPPLLAIREQMISHNLTWAILFAANNYRLSHAMGLVADYKTGGMSSADGCSVFMYLPNETEFEKVVASGASEVIKHSSASTLMKAICQCDYIPSINTLFALMDKNLKDNYDWVNTVFVTDIPNYHELATIYALYSL
ncbi:hypothetical protein ACHAPQ_009816 [Fusarium lateritium]